ncbi:MAG: ATP-binding protein [Treponema sp.]|nr:ATP-binding protein [Treponema sp.]
MFTNKSQQHVHHKAEINDIQYLKLAALYGANGAGKSNMIKALSVLKTFVLEGKCFENVENMKFRLNPENTEKPCSLGIEFITNGKTFFYTISFDETGVVYEYLSETSVGQDRRIFERIYDNHKENISFYDNDSVDPKQQLFVELLSEKFVSRNDILLYILQDKYPNDYQEAVLAYNWFEEKLIIVRADQRVQPVAHLFDVNKEVLHFANSLISRLSTGVNEISVTKKKYQKTEANSFIFDKLKERPNTISEMRNQITGEVVNYLKEDDIIVEKRVNASHKNINGDFVNFGLGLESDGTQRLMDLFPLFYDIINEDKVIIIDEIERSIHPIIIKNLISYISKVTPLKGQLIFSTHESCLLDLSIVRTDEIWFAQKNTYGSTELYSLSDFNVHNTANIENGYLNGRYGGIPFLSRLEDLSWRYELE